MLHGDVGDNLRHGAKCLIARLLGMGLVWFNPETRDLLLDRGLPHVTEEGTVDWRGGGGHVVGVARGVHVVHHVGLARPCHTGLV